MVHHAARADWKGSFTDGVGSTRLPDGSRHPFSAHTRFSQNGTAVTNPEDLLAGAFAASFSMALSFEIGEAGYRPTWIRAETSVELSPSPFGFRISGIRLRCRAEVPQIEEDEFILLARKAASGCPIASALNKATIHFDVELNNNAKQASRQAA